MNESMTKDWRYFLKEHEELDEITRAEKEVEKFKNAASGPKEPDEEQKGFDKKNQSINELLKATP